MEYTETISENQTAYNVNSLMVHEDMALKTLKGGQKM